MRGARIKMQLSDGYYHLYNRAAGCPGDFPFGDVEREQLVRLVTDLARFYVIEPIDYVIMSNHFHLVVFAPGKPPSPTKTAARYNAYYPFRAPLRPTEPECGRQAERMRDISEFMKDLQQKFTCWYNRSRTGGRRRGTLWAERFKSNLIEGQSGLWTLAKYVILNPWRAEMVEDPADYRWSSWGSWNGSGRHPFEKNYMRHIPKFIPCQTADQKWNAKTLMRELRADLVRTMAGAAGLRGKALLQAAKDARDHDAPLLLRVDRRARYFVDGMIIGSKRFIRKVAVEHDKLKERLDKEKLYPALLPDGRSVLIYRKLRNIRT